MGSGMTKYPKNDPYYKKKSSDSDKYYSKEYSSEYWRSDRPGSQKTKKEPFSARTEKSDFSFGNTYSDAVQNAPARRQSSFVSAFPPPAYGDFNAGGARKWK